MIEYNQVFNGNSMCTNSCNRPRADIYNYEVLSLSETCVFRIPLVFNFRSGLWCKLFFFKAFGISANFPQSPPKPFFFVCFQRFQSNACVFISGCILKITPLQHVLFSDNEPTAVKLGKRAKWLGSDDAPQTACSPFNYLIPVIRDPALKGT